MSSKLVRKTVCLLLILALVLTTLLVTPIGLAKNGKDKYDVTGTVYYETASGFSPIEGVTVKLLNLHTGAIIKDTTDKGGKYTFTDVSPGHYQVIAKPPSNNFLETENSKTIVEIDKKIEELNLWLDFIPTESKGELHGFIYDEESNPISGAQVILKSLDYPGYKVASIVTNDTGEYEVETFRGWFEVWAMGPKDPTPIYQYNITTINLSIPKMINYNITLYKPASLISGFVEYDGIDPEEGIWYLFDLNNGDLYYDNFTGSLFNIDAYLSNFSLIIDAVGYKPYYHPEIISLTPINSFKKFPINETVKLIETNDETIVTEIRFKNNDFNQLIMDSIWTLNHDSKLFGLEYVEYGDPVTIGDPRFQIDYEPSFGGTKDGVVSGEVEGDEGTNFNLWLNNDRGPDHIYTNSYFEINNTHFGWDKGSFEVKSTGFDNTFDSTLPMTITTELEYDHESTFPDSDIDPLDSKYYKVRFSKLMENEVIVFHVPTGYEISNPNSYDTEKVWIKESDLCQINSTATIYLAALKEPTAEFEVEDDYVDTMVNITFNGSESLPGSGVIDNYTWDFDNGEFGYGLEKIYNYTNPGIYNVTLTVTTTANLISTDWQVITIDNTPPEVDYIFQNETNATITFGYEDSPEEGEYIIKFNGTKSTDTIDGKIEGRIEKYLWKFGDISGQTSNREVSEHGYDQPDTYNVTLFVTDAAGHEANKTVQLEILDRTKPEPAVKTEPLGGTCEIDKWILLNASVSTDNHDDAEDMEYWWDLNVEIDSDGNGILDDDREGEGIIYNFTADSPGQYFYRLWVKDTAGNQANSSHKPPQEFMVDVVGVDLRLAPIQIEIDKFIEVSKDKPKVGDRVKFKVNVTNEGRVTAYDVMVSFLVDSTEEDMKIIDSLEQFDFRVMDFSWKASGKGKHNISFSVTLLNETYEQNIDNNERSLELEVLEEEIDPWFIIIIVVIIIILLGVIYYFTRRKREEREYLRQKDKGKKGKGKKGKGKKSEGKDKKDKKEKKEKKDSD